MAEQRKGGQGVGQVRNSSEDQSETRNIIRQVRDEAFDSSDELLALALGRPVEQVRALVEGVEEPDDDVVMKVRGIAEERGVELSDASSIPLREP